MNDILAGPRFAFAALLALVVGCASPAPAQALFPTLGPFEQPGPFVREAFASPYGRALVAELGKALLASADPACLQSKTLAPEQLSARGEQLIIAWGTRAMETVTSYTDMKVYEQKLAQSAGRNAAAEMKRLRGDADVKRYLAIERPARLAAVLDFVIEQFDRYALLNGLKLTHVSPLATGNMQLFIVDPTADAEAAMEEFEKANKSEAFGRFLALTRQAADAMTASLKQEQALQSGPNTFYRGMDSDLAKLCIGKR